MNTNIPFAPLKDYPPLIGMRHVEWVFYWLHEHMLKRLPRSLTEKDIHLSFFINKEDGFVYALTRRELELWKGIRDSERYLKHLNYMLRHRWKKNSSIVGELIRQRHGGRHDERLYIYLQDWLNCAETYMNKLKRQSPRIYEERRMITELETVMFQRNDKTYKWLLDLPVYNPYGVTIGAIQILSGQDMNRETRKQLAVTASEMAPAIWLATEIDRLQREILTELPISMFLGQHIEYITIEDAYRILHYSEAQK